MNVAYIPKIVCAKCGTELRANRVHDRTSDRRYLKVFCHGAEQQIDFVSEAGMTVKAFEPAA